LKIVSFDPSSTNVGYCVAEDGKYCESGVFKPKGKDREARLGSIFWWVLAFLQEHRPDVVAFEEPAGDHRNRKTDRLLANVGGLILAAAFLVETPRCVRVWPSQVKASRCSKENRVYAAAVSGKRKVGPDEADAMGVWLAAEKLIGQEVYVCGYNGNR
jgi:Holliday junction resolvasome RuvABC endonuclease subunit